MYVWARMARMLATARSRGPYVMGGESRLAFRCLPTDIDFNIHLNNAHYPACWRKPRRCSTSARSFGAMFRRLG